MPLNGKGILPLHFLNKNWVLAFILQLLHLITLPDTTTTTASWILDTLSQLKIPVPRHAQVLGPQVTTPFLPQLPDDSTHLTIKLCTFKKCFFLPCIPVFHSFLFLHVQSHPVKGEDCRI